MRRFVRERRTRLAPESEFLGERPRLPIRVGKRVTQEEVAEHLGISRGWYARFEAGAHAGFSIALLGRLGDILLLSQPERAELVRLAMPELAPVVRPHSTDLCEALGAMRRIVKRLCRATSEDEILHIAGEEARQLVPSFDVIFARRIVAPRETQFPQQGSTCAARLADARAYALRQVSPEQYARLNVFWQRTTRGEILPIDAYPPEHLRVYRRSLQEHGIDWDSPLSAHIRGSSGSALVGGTSARPHDVSAIERSILSTIADFASLALH